MFFFETRLIFWAVAGRKNTLPNQVERNVSSHNPTTNPKKTWKNNTTMVDLVFVTAFSQHLSNIVVFVN